MVDQHEIYCILGCNSDLWVTSFLPLICHPLVAECTFFFPFLLILSVSYATVSHFCSISKNTCTTSHHVLFPEWVPDLPEWHFFHINNSIIFFSQRFSMQMGQFHFREKKKKKREIFFWTLSPIWKLFKILLIVWMTLCVKGIGDMSYQVY